MADVGTTGKVMSRKKPAAGKGAGATPDFERVEFQAPLGWTKTVDAAAAELGLSRSAYIRMAVARQMKADQKDSGDKGKQEG